jgi:hypothetical protein
MDDPEWVPTHKMVLESPGSPMPYTLRPRRPKFTNEEEGDNMDNMENMDQLILSNTKISTKSRKNLVITISQRIKKDVLVDLVQNEQLPCIPFPIHTFDDLYKLADHVHTTGSMYKDCQRLPELLPVLKELDDMVGLKSTKNALCNMILFELQSIPCYWRHMVITGAPGMGKTSIATIIGKLLNKLGRTPSSDITRGNPLNMIADYEGQTKSEVNRVVQEALSKSGVLLIDEAPSLYDKQNKDSYGKKCLDMLMQLMDTYRDRLIVIFAGYKKDMEENILQSNEGFRRRIQWYFHMDEYNSNELHLIFRQKMGVLNDQTMFNQNWFHTNYKAFPFFGGSIENFVQKIRIVHTRKTFGSAQKDVITDETIQEGFELYLKFTV